MKRWIERWHGSGPDRGWAIWEVGHGDRIAYVGEGEHSQRLATIIVAAHNAAPVNLSWCNHCGEGVTTFCRGKTAECPSRLALPGAPIDDALQSILRETVDEIGRARAWIAKQEGKEPDPWQYATGPVGMAMYRALLAGGDQKAAPLHPSPDEDDGGPEQFRRQEPYRKLVSEWLRETMGSVEADNVGKPEFMALVNLCDRAAALHPSSVQAVDGDEPTDAQIWALAKRRIGFHQNRPDGRLSADNVDDVEIMSFARDVLAIRAAMKDKGHDN